MKTKKIILTAAVLFLSLLIRAQDKYEFMVIIYYPHQNELTVSIDGKEFIREDVTLEKSVRSHRNANAILKKISEYQDQNWELMTFTNTPLGISGNSYEEYFAYLRKKKIDEK